MASWILKTTVQQIIGRLPRSYWWNLQFQKYLTHGHFPRRETFEGKLRCCKHHHEHYRKFNPESDTAFTALELGTGPWPIVPMGLYLCGASEIWTYDLVPLLQRDIFRKILLFFEEFNRDGRLQQILGKVKEERLTHLRDLLLDVDREIPIQLLKRLNIHALVGDARSTNLPNESIDLIFSTVVLEHISADCLIGLFAEFKRFASKHAVMSHLIGLGDQFASFDKSITPFNFLKYSDRQWRIYNTPINPQTRLRIADYREIFRKTGWEILEERNTLGSLEELKKIPLADKYQSHTAADLQVLFSWLVARPV